LNALNAFVNLCVAVKGKQNGAGRLSALMEAAVELGKFRIASGNSISSTASSLVRTMDHARASNACFQKLYSVNAFWPLVFVTNPILWHALFTLCIWFLIIIAKTVTLLYLCFAFCRLLPSLRVVAQMK
jgi:hypothetical protein